MNSEDRANAIQCRIFPSSCSASADFSGPAVWLHAFYYRLSGPAPDADRGAQTLQEVPVYQHLATDPRSCMVCSVWHLEQSTRHILQLDSITLTPKCSPDQGRLQLPDISGPRVVKNKILCFCRNFLTTQGGILFTQSIQQCFAQQ